MRSDRIEILDDFSRYLLDPGDVPRLSLDVGLRRIDEGRVEAGDELLAPAVLISARAGEIRDREALFSNRAKRLSSCSMRLSP